MRKFLDIISGSVEKSDEPQTKTNLLQRYLGVIEEGYVNQTINGLKVDEFVRGYIEAMLWSSKESLTSTGMPGEATSEFTADDIDHETMDRIYADCRSFLHKAGPYLTVDKYKGPGLTTLEAMAGHDFWLTRVGHGSGFWDGDWDGEDHGGLDGPLTKISKEFGNVDPYIGDDRKIHLM